MVQNLSPLHRPTASIGSFSFVVRFQGRHPGVFIFFLIFGLFSVFVTQDLRAGSKQPKTQRPYIINKKRYYPIPSSHGYTETGIASWYGKYFHGRLTSNGEIYNMHDMTAAHKTLPMNTVVLVKNKENNRDVVVRINDRGPFVRGRIIDLSYKAAQKLGIVGDGIAKVQVVALGEGSGGGTGGTTQLAYKNLTAGEFYVQIGAFAQKINAINLQERFTNAGHTTVIQKYFGPKKILYRVHVYAGKSLNNAKRAEKALLEHGYVGSFIIAR